LDLGQSITVADSPATRRFGVFTFDSSRLELTRGGQPVKLQRQPAMVLATLVSRAGHVVTREELRQVVWRDDTYVDFERGLNFCIAQIRAALGDTAATPRYVRTIAKQGYEFICPVDAAENGRGRHWAVIWGMTAAVGLALAAIVVWKAIPRQPTPIVIAVARFDNETGDSTLTRLSDSLTDSVVAELTSDGPDRYAIIGNAALLRRDRANRDLGAIATELHAQYVVLGQLQRDDTGFRVLAHLIHLPEQTHVAVSRTDQIADVSLSAVDGLAVKIAKAFDARLRANPAPLSSRPSPPTPSH
jgi:DNA-binding winged helix-turn-helix (wHTH) protein/TolB-like protein